MSHKLAQFYTIESRFELSKLKKKKANTKKYTFNHRDTSLPKLIMFCLYFSNDFKIKIVLDICSQIVKIAKYEIFLYSILQY